MTLVTLFSGILNSIGKFATAAAAPILLNLTMVATLLTAAFFPTARPRGGVGRADRGRARGAARRRRGAARRRDDHAAAALARRAR